MIIRNWCKFLLWIGIGLLAFSLFGSMLFGDKAPHRLEARILRAAQAQLSDNNISWAKIEARGQKLIVSGLAPSEAERTNALNIARKSIGKGGLIFGGVTRAIDSTELGERISPYVWQAEVIDETLMLTGHAPSSEAIEEILNASQNKGWSNIDNQLKLGVGVVDVSAWTDMAELGLEQLAGLEPGKVVLSDFHMTVSGEATGNDKVDSIATVLANLSSPYSAVSTVTGPYNWSAEKRGDQIILSGLVPDGESKRAMTRVISDNFDGEVVDETGIGGERGWVRTAIKALPQFSRFQSGKLSYSNKNLYVEGVAPDSVYSFLADDLKYVGNQFGVQYNVDVLEPELTELGDLPLRENGNNLSGVCQDAFALIMDANKIYFETARADISRQSGSTLDKLIAVARRCNDVSIRIEGHTDNVGSRTMNIGLSNRRAQTVAQYLIDRGYPEGKLSYQGYGPDQPDASNETPEGRAVNRRIEFIVTSEETR